MPKIATLCLLIVFFGCDNTPRVRLVKDNDYTIHFQWNKPLKEERIILVHFSGEVGEPVLKREGGIPVRWEWEKQYSYNPNHLLYFPAGSIISARVYVDEKMLAEHGLRARRIHSVEILPADLRNTVDFPATLNVIEDGDFEPFGDRVILREHPFFQEYHIDEPSSLTFEH